MVLPSFDNVIQAFAQVVEQLKPQESGLDGAFSVDSGHFGTLSSPSDSGVPQAGTQTSLTPSWDVSTGIPV